MYILPEKDDRFNLKQTKLKIDLKPDLWDNFIMFLFDYFEIKHTTLTNKKTRKQ